MAAGIKTKSSAGLLIVIIVAILIIINLISINWFSRLDLTDNSIYSLSDASRALVENLNDNLIVKAYFSDDLPAPHNNDSRYLKDLLDDYRAYSGGYLQYEFIDPVKTDKEEEAMSYRIPPLQFNVFRNEKTEFIKGFKGVVLLYGDKQEVLPFVEKTENLEYDLSRAINKLSQIDIPTVAFTAGHGEPDVSTGLNWTNQILQKEYRVQYLNLMDLKTIPSEVDVLIIASPRETFDIWEIYLIDQFIMRGGRAAFLLNNFSIDVQQSLVLPIETGLDSLLKFYGVTVRDSIIIDRQSNMVPITRNMGEFQMQHLVNYPFYISITNFSEENPIVKSLNKFDVLFISPLNLDYEIDPERKREILFTTSEQSGQRGLPVDISPEKRYFDSDYMSSRLPLAAAVTGRFDSYFNDQYIPEYPGSDTLTDIVVPEKIDNVSDGRIAVFGNGSFITDEYRRNQASFVILLNTIDWMTQDIGLISIRSKQVGGRTLDIVSDSGKKWIKYINMFAMPVIVIIFGVIRWQYKRSRRKKEART
jgi:gliding-associated putative ABC transporter substrate-binding component GldG